MTQIYRSKSTNLFKNVLEKVLNTINFHILYIIHQNIYIYIKLNQSHMVQPTYRNIFIRLCKGQEVS